MTAGSPDDFSIARPRQAAPEALKRRALPLPHIYAENVPDIVFSPPRHLMSTFRRTVIGFIGGGFLVVGLALFVMGTVAFVFQGQSPEPVGVLMIFPVSLLGIVLGIVLLFSFAVEASITNEGLLLTFVWSKEKLIWDQVSWYKYLAWGWRFTGGVNLWLWTIMKYARSGGKTQNNRKVLLRVKAREPLVGWRIRNYTTKLDEFIPSKDKTRR